MPRLLHDVVLQLLAGDPEVEVVEDGSGGSLAAAVARSGAQVVVQAGSGELPPEGRGALYAYPRLRLVLVRPDGRAAVVWRLSPTRVDVADVSPAELLDAVRATGRFGEA